MQNRLYKTTFVLFAYYMFLSYIELYASQTIALLILYYLLINTLLLKANIKNCYLQGSIVRVYDLYVVWTLLVVIRGLLFNYNSIFDVATDALNQYSLLAYLMPLFVLYPIKKFPFRIYIKFAIFMCVLMLCFTAFFYDDIFVKTYSLTVGKYADNSYGLLVNVASKATLGLSYASLLLMLPGFTSRKKWIFIVVCFILALVISAKAGRRSGMAYYVMMLSLAFYLFTLTTKYKKLSRFFIITFILIIIYVLFTEYSSSFDILTQRANIDSRSGVENEMIDSFNDEPLDWLFGRGLRGTYTSHIIGADLGKFMHQRHAMETGYLYIILQGGVIMLLLYLFLFIRSAYLGWFKSNNTLTKGFSALLIIQVLNLIPFGLPEFSIVNFFFWIGISFCNSSEIRSLSDYEIKKLYFCDK